MLEVQLDHRYCPTCESEQLFEAPLCQDGHGAACPDLACVNCGMAMFVVVISDTASHLPSGHLTPSGHRPAQHRRIA